MSEAPGEPEGAPTSALAEDARPQRTVPAGAFVVTLMVAAALAVLAVVALATDTSGDTGSSDRDVRLAAGRFSERFLTFEHDALDDWKEGVLALSTRGFAREVEEVESGLRTLIAESRLDATTQVTDIFVGEEERGAVSVVVIYDRALRGEQVDRTETDRYLQVAMIRVDGSWLVDNVIDIATAGDQGPVTPAPSAPEPAPEAPSEPAPGAPEEPEADDDEPGAGG
jgi:hypothetical protein